MTELSPLHWTQIYQHIRLDHILKNKLYLVNKECNTNFRERHLLLWKYSSREFSHWMNRNPRYGPYSDETDEFVDEEEEEQEDEKESTFLLEDDEKEDDNENEKEEEEEEENEEEEEEDEEKEDDDDEGKEEEEEEEEPKRKRNKVDYTETKEYKKRMAIVKDSIPSWILRRGDVIRFGSDDYRNSGKMMWEGEKLIDLDHHNGDDYGICPKDFLIDEFPSTDYFTRVVDHNESVWINLSNYEVLQEKKVEDDNGEAIAYELKNKTTGKILYFEGYPDTCKKTLSKKRAQVVRYCTEWERLVDVFPQVTAHNAISDVY